MKKIVIVFMSLFLIVPASGQIYLEQVNPADIGKGIEDWPAYFGCADYGGAGGDISIVPLEAYQDFGWQAYTEGAAPDLKLCVKAWDVVPPNPPGSDVKVADLYVGVDHFDVVMYSAYHIRITTTPGGILEYMEWEGPWPPDLPPTFNIYYAYINHNELWVTCSAQPPLDTPALIIYAAPKLGYKFVGLSGTAADMGYAYGTPIEGTQWTEVWIDVGDFFENVPEQCYIEVIFAKSVPTELDIKPGSCPNPLNVKDKGELPVAILGTEYFDISDVDIGTVSLAGVAPIRFDYEDVATPFEGELCDCHELGPDGYLDLTLKFDTQEILDTLGEVEDGDVLELILMGEDVAGIPMEGSDCIRIIKKSQG